MCGKATPNSPGLVFHQDLRGSVHAVFETDDSHQGHEGLMHGGVLSAILDTAMAQCLIHKNIKAVTGELNVRYISRVPSGSILHISAWIDSSLPPLFHLKSVIRVNGVLVCRGRGKFMEIEDD